MDFKEAFDKEANVRRLWMLVPGKREAYTPGFEGTFPEALAEAAGNAAFWKTVVFVYEADPQNYRRMGGLKKVWAVVRIPTESPLRQEACPVAHKTEG